MGRFTDSIVGGIGTLIREFIQSPNFVTGVSGWRISKNGDAEFNNIFIRGTLELPANVAPGEVGTIWWNDGNTQEHAQIFRQNNAVVITGGSDSTVGFHDANIVFGKESAAGDDAFTDWQNAGGRNAVKGTEILQDSGSMQMFSALLNSFGSFQRGAMIRLEDGHAKLVPPGNIGTDSFVDVNPNGIRFGSAGPTGKYYSEQRTLSGLAIANNANVLLTPGASQDLHSDYGSAWVGNTWTCPVDSDYTWTLVCFGIPGGTPRAYARISINGNIQFADDGAIGGSGKECGGTVKMISGDTVQLSTFQNSGAPLNLNAQSMVKVRREL